MNEATTEDLITKAQKNDNEAREALIRKHRPDIAAAVSAVCKRPVNWSNDDELSIGLIAFNEAIDKYNQKHEIKFINFARTVIKRRLIDYFRKESKHRHQSLEVFDEEFEHNKYKIDVAVKNYQEQEQASKQEVLINQYVNELQKHGISLQELVQISPKHEKRRKVLLSTAITMVDDERLMDKFLRTGKIPLKQLQLKAGCSRKVLEHGRKYIIAIVIILINPEYSSLRSFLNLESKGGK